MDKQNQSTEEEVSELERELEKYKEITPHNKAFFGEPFEDFKSKLEKETARKLKERCEDWVINPLLGFTHWTTVKYAMDKDYISKKGEEWCIRAKETTITFKGGYIYPWASAERFNMFKKKLDALKEREKKKEYKIQQTIENQQ